jgi:hypothetical protein
MRTDGQRTDMTRLIVAVRNFANTPKNGENVLVDTRLFILQGGLFSMERVVKCHDNNSAAKLSVTSKNMHRAPF